MKMRVPILACILMLGTCHLATADLMVSFDMDLGADGVQDHRTVMLGDEFSVGVMFTMSGNTSLAAYGFSARFNTDALDFLGRIETPPPPLAETDKSNPFRDYAGSNDPLLGPANYGELTRFDGLTLFSGPSGPNVFQVATLTFKAVAVPQAGTSLHMISGMFEPGFDGFFDNDFGDLGGSMTFHGGSLTVVPEPSSLVLILTALSVGGFALVRSRRHAHRG